MDSNPLFVPQKMGNLSVPNRVFLAPLTRNRAYDDGTPREDAAIYYAQRASAGLLISEAVDASPLGKGYINTPGMYTDKQVQAWKPITAAAHANGGRIFCQLGHVGRIRHSSIEPEGEQPVAPSAIRADAKTFTHKGYENVSKPRALSIEEIDQIIADYAQAAIRAMEAGFDGIEIHAANGYLISQFLHQYANKRNDEYGGSIENRCKFVMHIIDRLIEEIGAAKIGIRFSPNEEANDMKASDSLALYSYLIDELDKRELAYLHLVESFEGIDSDADKATTIKEIRKHWSGFYVANGNYTAKRAVKAVAEGWCDAVAIGHLFLANPDLPSRWLNDVPLNEPDEDTFYGGDQKGYIDYPFATYGRDGNYDFS